MEKLSKQQLKNRSHCAMWAKYCPNRRVFQSCLKHLKLASICRRLGGRVFHKWQRKSVTEMISCPRHRSWFYFRFRPMFV